MADGKYKCAGDKRNEARPRLPPLHVIILTQAAVLLPLLVAIALGAGRVTAASFAAGAAVSILPQAWLAFLVLGVQRQRLLRGAYTVQAGKFVLSAVGFALIFALLRPIDAPAVFAGFGAMWLLQVAGSARLLRAYY